jgi:hypothetical protein
VYSQRIFSGSGTPSRGYLCLYCLSIKLCHVLFSLCVSVFFFFTLSLLTKSDLLCLAKTSQPSSRCVHVVWRHGCVLF